MQPLTHRPLHGRKKRCIRGDRGPAVGSASEGRRSGRRGGEKRFLAFRQRLEGFPASGDRRSFRCGNLAASYFDVCRAALRHCHYCRIHALVVPAPTLPIFERLRSLLVMTKMLTELLVNSGGYVPFRYQCSQPSRSRFIFPACLLASRVLHSACGDLKKETLPHLATHVACLEGGCRRVAWNGAR